MYICVFCVIVFFFQAEDGIRDRLVTGVQTCALPILKDNHIAIEGNIRELVKRAIRNKKGKKITVEVDNLNQLRKIIGLKFNRILFDNMNSNNLRRGIKISNKLYETEASGGVTLNNVRKIASTGVKRISVGQITHSASAADFKIGRAHV